MLKYVKDRFAERTTWAAIGAAVATAAGLTWPWNVISVVIATIVALTPMKPGEKEPEA